jgi:hypothetical protein
MAATPFGEAHNSPDYWARLQSNDTYKATLLPTHDQWIPLQPSSQPLPPVDVMAKVTEWLDTQYPPTFSELPREPGNSQFSAPPSPTPTVERKMVHWTPSVEDNHGKTSRWLKTKMDDSTKQTNALRQIKSRRKTPAVPNPPKARRPPPAPRPRRLATPELPNLQHAQFCACCSTNPVEKMNAQSKILKHSLSPDNAPPNIHSGGRCYAYCSCNAVCPPLDRMLWVTSL